MIFLFVRPRNAYEITATIAAVAATVLVVVTGSPWGFAVAAICLGALLVVRLSPRRLIQAILSLGFLTWVASSVFGTHVGFVITLCLGAIILSAAEFSSSKPQRPSDVSDPPTAP